MHRPRPRGAVLAVLLAAVLLLSGCVVTLGGGRPRAAEPPPPDVRDGVVTIVGAEDGPVDILARNALADLGSYWADRFPEVFGTRFQPLAGGFFSVDPDDVDPATYPEGIGCGTDPRDVENNAFYCRAPDVPHSDAISYDRVFLGELAESYGRFLPALVMAHEYGHAVQARVGYPRTSIATETQADCLAGAWTAWVAAGEAPHTRIRETELDQLLRGYLRLRDPVGTGPTAEQAHGSYFDRVSAFQEGFDDGPVPCRDNFGPGRAYTQDEFTSDRDFTAGGDAPYPTVETILAESLPAFWRRAFTEVLGGRFSPPAIEPFRGTAPACADPDADLVACPDEDLVGYDERDLVGPLYAEIGDFAVLTAVAVPYALEARDQLGLPSDGARALRSAVCLTGWYAAAVYERQIPDVTISPGDVDESVQFLLAYGDDPAVLGAADVSGFQLVDLFRNGFFQGVAACDVGA